jgi:hypothetical protein
MPREQSNTVQGIISRAIDADYRALPNEVKGRLPFIKAIQAVNRWMKDTQFDQWAANHNVPAPPDDQALAAEIKKRLVKTVEWKQWISGSAQSFALRLF